MGTPGDSRSGGRGMEPVVRRPHARRLRLDIVRQDGDWSTFVPLVRTAEQAANALAGLAQLASARGRASLLLTSDAAVRTLNRTWRGQDKPTNVLSFPAPAIARSGGGRGLPFLGDLVMAAETLAIEAARDGVPPRHHLQHLVVHGLLHLLGFDHETAAEAEIMEALEVAALARIGVASPYQDAVLAEIG